MVSGGEWLEIRAESRIPPAISPGRSQLVLIGQSTVSEDHGGKRPLFGVLLGGGHRAKGRSKTFTLKIAALVEEREENHDCDHG